MSAWDKEPRNKKYSGAFVKKVLEATDIVEIIRLEVCLEGLDDDGRRFRGVCPLDQNDAPMFHVDRESQVFRCDHCRAGGSALTFLMLHWRTSFERAIEMLADRAGIPLEPRKAEGKDGADVPSGK